MNDTIIPFKKPEPRDLPPPAPERLHPPKPQLAKDIYYRQLTGVMEFGKQPGAYEFIAVKVD